MPAIAPKTTVLSGPDAQCGVILRLPFVSLKSTRPADCCTWPEIKCDATKNIISISGFEAGTMDGGLPTELGQLTRLQLLSLPDQAFKGSIPTDLGNLASLSILNLAGSKLTGPVPDAVWHLPLLVHLDLSRNSLVGSVPTLTNPRLQKLHLQDNHFGGAFPDLTGLGQLADLSMAKNFFTGVLPALPRASSACTILAPTNETNQFTCHCTNPSTTATNTTLCDANVADLLAICTSTYPSDSALPAGARTIRAALLSGREAVTVASWTLAGLVAGLVMVVVVVGVVQRYRRGCAVGAARSKP
ncbi:hypothetical protein BC828DRAFT_381436 [Blastocladiella britannica]|nr:hypothetical protein BC828DRAFT_381436 [Blastocladiella britannica]